MQDENTIPADPSNAIEDRLEEKINNFMKLPFQNEEEELNSSILTPPHSAVPSDFNEEVRFGTPKPNSYDDDPLDSFYTPETQKRSETAPLQVEYTPYPQLYDKSMVKKYSSRKEYCPVTGISNYKVGDEPTTVDKETSVDKHHLRQEALRLHNIQDISEDDFNNLIADFADERRRCIYSHNFHDSKHLTEVINHLCSCQMQQRKKDMQKEAIRQYEESVKKFEADLNEFDNETNAQVQDNRNRYDEMKLRITTQHVAEQNDLQNLWSSPSKARQYAHASPELIRMRKLFKQNVLAEKFDEAEQMKKEIAQLENRDKQNALAIMQHDFDLASETLQKKQDAEIMSLEDDMKSAQNSIMVVRGKQRLAFVNRAKKIARQKEIIKDANKLWNQMQMQRRDELFRGTASRSSTTRKIKLSDVDNLTRTSNEARIILPQLSFDKLPVAPKSARVRGSTAQYIRKK